MLLWLFGRKICYCPVKTSLRQEILRQLLYFLASFSCLNRLVPGKEPGNFQPMFLMALLTARMREVRQAQLPASYNLNGCPVSLTVAAQINQKIRCKLIIQSTMNKKLFVFSISLTVRGAAVVEKYLV